MSFEGPYLRLLVVLPLPVAPALGGPGHLVELLLHAIQPLLYRNDCLALRLLGVMLLGWRSTLLLLEVGLCCVEGLLHTLAGGCKLIGDEVEVSWVLGNRRGNRQ